MKVCTKCGTAKKKCEFGFESTPRKSGRKALRAKCKKCMSELISDWKKRNPDKVKNSRKRTYKKDKERVKKWVKENKGKRNDIHKRWRRKQMAELRDGYIIYRLKKIGFSKEVIKETPYLVSIERLIIKTKRLLKTNNHDN